MFSPLLSKEEGKVQGTLYSSLLSREEEGRGQGLLEVEGNELCFLLHF